MRELYQESRLFKVGILSLAGSLAFALVVLTVVHWPDGRSASAEPDLAATEESTSMDTSPEDSGLRTTPYVTIEEQKEQPDNPEEQQSRTSGAASQSVSGGPTPQEPPRREQPDRISLPVRGDDWPGANRQETQRASEPRDYGWTLGAVMTFSSPALRVSDAPVFDNYSSRNLTQGIGHVPQTSLPWQQGKQKNVYLAAHRLGWPGTGSRLLFYNLDKLEKGDTVSLENRQGDEYRYRVTKKLVVEPSDSWVMGEVRGKDLLTLQTCTPIPTFDKRLIVRAERI